MKKKITLKKMLLKKENLLLLAMFGLLFVFGCYEFSSINQPTEGITNSSFDVSLVMKQDADATNDWTSEAGDLMQTGIFGVLLPTGWTVTDNAAVRVESFDAMLDGNGVSQTSTSDHSGDYVLTYQESLTTMLSDSAGAPPAGYYWWGAKSATEVDMAFFDSLYFTISIMTDDQVGDFYLQYTTGDVEYWERNPVHFKSAPMQITIAQGVGVNELLTEDAISVYPNPSYGNLNIDLKSFKGETVDIMIYDIRGRQVRSGQITNAHTMLDLVDIAPGVYVLRMESGEETITHKFLKH